MDVYSDPVEQSDTAHGFQDQPSKPCFLAETLPAPVVAGYDDLNHNEGASTWNYPVFPTCKSKPQKIFKYNGHTRMFDSGSHMSLITFVGDANHKSRSPEAFRERDSKAAARGPGWDKPSREKRAMQASGSGYQQR